MIKKDTWNVFIQASVHFHVLVTFHPYKSVSLEVLHSNSYQLICILVIYDFKEPPVELIIELN